MSELIKQTIDLAKTLGEYVLYQFRAAQTDPNQMAHLSYYSSPDLNEPQDEVLAA